MSKNRQKALDTYEKQCCEYITREDGIYVRVMADKFTKWRRLSRDRDRTSTARELLPRILLVSLVSQYDAFLGRLLKTIFLLKPELLNASDRQVPFEKINQFRTIEDLRGFILDKEIETVLRKSHLEQLVWMEKAFNVDLRKGLESLPSFIEVTERRNLFVHADGVASAQYLSTCQANGVSLEAGTCVGSQLEVPQAYFGEACICIHEIGVKLGHVVWRKLFPHEREDADNHYLEYTFELLQAGKHRLAARLLDLACSVFAKQSAESEGLIFRINLAQAHKWNGDEDRCRRVLAETDWSAKEDKFKLAHAVLHDNWTEVGALMRRIGSSDAVGRNAYRDWPLFRKLREQPIFATTYAEIFGAPYEPPTETRKRRRKRKDSQTDDQQRPADGQNGQPDAS
jgi:hypothetical protein